MKLTFESRQILNLQADKNAFINDAIQFYQKSDLPVDERVKLQQAEIARLTQQLAANEMYILELKDTEKKLRIKLAEKPKIAPLDLSRKITEIQALNQQLQEAKKLTSEEKQAIKLNDIKKYHSGELKVLREKNKKLQQTNMELIIKIAQLTK